MTRVADAELAVELGAWALGMIFYAGSPRRCGLPEAIVIASRLRRRVELCGVFVNESLPRIAAVSEQVGLSMIQLHGDEGPSFCAEVARRTGAKVVKAVQIAGAGDVRGLERYHVDFHLADATARPGTGGQRLRGGTGATFDWSLLAARRSATPLILSGGLTPENVAEAIETVHPYAVDVASGVEQAPGRKDEAKLRALFAAVAAATSAAAQAGAKAVA